MTKLFIVNSTSLYNLHFNNSSSFNLLYANFKKLIEKKSIENLVYRHKGLSFDYKIIKPYDLIISLKQNQIILDIGDKKLNNSLKFKINSNFDYSKFIYLFKICNFNDSKPHMRRIKCFRSKEATLFPAREVVLCSSICKSFVSLEKSIFTKPLSEKFLIIFSLNRSSFHSNKINFILEIGNLLSKLKSIKLLNINEEILLSNKINFILDYAQDKYLFKSKPLNLKSVIDYYFHENKSLAYYTFPKTINNDFFNKISQLSQIKSSCSIQIFISYELFIHNYTKSFDDFKHFVNFIETIISICLDEKTEIRKYYTNQRKLLRNAFKTYIKSRIKPELELPLDYLLDFIDNEIYLNMQFEDFIEIIQGLQQHIKLYIKIIQ